MILAPQPAASSARIPRRNAVDLHCKLGLVFRLIHVGVGRRIDDDVRLDGPNRLPDRFGAREIEQDVGSGSGREHEVQIRMIRCTVREASGEPDLLFR